MKKNLLIVLTTILLTACGANNSNNSSASSGTNNSSAKPAIGDLVAAKYGTNLFREGKIQSIEGQKANIGWSDKNYASNDVDLANVYPIPKAGASTNVKAGDFVLAKTSASSVDDSKWYIAQVTSINSGVIAVKDVHDQSYSLSPDKVIAVSPTDTADIKAELDKNSKEGDFLGESHKFQPTAPAGYKPKVGETVVAEIGMYDWYTGQVKSISDDKATIVWDPENNRTSDTRLVKIVPYPTAASAAMPAVNDYILIKPDATKLWTYVQVTSVNGTSAVVKDINGKTSTVKPGEFILLK
jgi:hypothetical protein